jgi:hypothetical protein
MTSAEIIAELRTLWGLPTTDYPDSKLTVLIDKARKKLSEYYPELELAYTTTVSGQTLYTVTHTTLIALKQIYYQSSVDKTSMFNDPDIRESLPTEDSTFSLSRGFEFIQRLKTMQELYPSEGVIKTHNKFELLPTPSQSGIRVYYEYARYRTLAEIPTLFEEDIQALVMFYIKDIQYKKSSRLQAGNRYDFDRRGNIKEGSTGGNEEKQHAQIEEDIVKNIKLKVMKL